MTDTSKKTKKRSTKKSSSTQKALNIDQELDLAFADAAGIDIDTAPTGSKNDKNNIDFDPRLFDQQFR